MVRRSRVSAIVLVLVGALCALTGWLLVAGDKDDRRSHAPRTESHVDVGDAPNESVRRHARAPTDRTPVAEGPDANTDLVPLLPAVSGRVVDRNGSPVAGARIVSYPDDVTDCVRADAAGTPGTRSQVAISADDGTFAVSHDPDGVGIVLTATADAGFGQRVVEPGATSAEIVVFPWTTVRGHVRDTEGRPIAGARLTMTLMVDALVEARSASTDDEGRYELDRLPTVGGAAFDGEKHVGGRHAWLLAESEGRASVVLDCTERLGAAARGGAEVDVVLRGGTTVIGHVVDAESGAPIAGARVVCWAVDHNSVYMTSSGVMRRPPGMQRALHDTTTDGDGAFAVAHVPAAADGDVPAERRSAAYLAAWTDAYVYGTAIVPLAAEGSQIPVEIGLWPAAAVEGRVVDGSGAAVADAVVRVDVPDRRTKPLGVPALWPDAPAADGRTDADGRYRLDLLRASRQGATSARVFAFRAMAGTPLRSTTEETSASAGTTAAVPDLVLDTGALIGARIVVRDAAGAPVSGASVELSALPARTDARGVHEWWARAPDTGEPAATTCVVRADGHGPAEVTFAPTRGVLADVTVTLPAPQRITGRVTTADGRPVAGARVHVLSGGVDPADVLPRDTIYFPGARADATPRLVHLGDARVGPDGAFEIDGLPDGPYHVVAEMVSSAPRAAGSALPALRDVRSGVAAGERDLVLTVPADDAPQARLLELRVEDEAGRPVEQCRGIGTFGSIATFATVPGPGRLQFPRAPFGAARVLVMAEGYRSERIDGLRVDAESPAEPPLVVLSRGVTLSGRLRPDSGEIPAGTIVILRPVEGDGRLGIVTARVAADGTFTASGLRPGATHVGLTQERGDASAASFLPEPAPILTLSDAAEQSCDVTVRPAVELQVRVTDPAFAPNPLTGRPATDDQIRRSTASRIEVVDSLGGVSISFSPVHAGVLERTFVPPGDFVVRVVAPGAAPREVRRTAALGERVSVSFE